MDYIKGTKLPPKPRKKVTGGVAPSRITDDRIVPVWSPSGELLGYGGLAKTGGLVCFAKTKDEVRKGLVRSRVDLQNTRDGQVCGPKRQRNIPDSWT